MPEPTPEDSRTDDTAKRKKGGVSTTKIVIVFALPILLIPLVVLSYRAYRHRAYNNQTAATVLRVGEALRRLDDNRILDLTVAGPAPVPGLPGQQVSSGTTLFIRRWRSGDTYVRGSHRDGSAAYYYRNGTLYVAALSETG